MRFGYDWKTSPDSTTGWHTFTRPEGLDVVHVAVLSAITDPFVTGVPLGQLAMHLQTWQLATGAHYRHTPGVAALASIRAMPRAARPRWVLRNPATVEYWEPPANISPPRYVAPHNVFSGCKAHKWDMRSAFLAAMAA